jgi:hypothetical protein
MSPFFFCRDKKWACLLIYFKFAILEFEINLKYAESIEIPTAIGLM